VPCRWISPLLSGFVGLALLGCQASAPGDLPAPAVAVARPSTARVAPVSPALAFVAAARPGQRATVTDPAFGGAVVVEIEARYHSASNRACRRFSVSRTVAPARRQTKFACFTAAGLELVDIY